MPQLSVLMPVKNGERYLKRALRSTLRALPKDANLVVLDDGSTDRSSEILAAHACSKLVVHRTEVSRGIAHGLNLLLGLTDSEFVGRMDADDVVLPWRFRRQLRLAQHADLVFTSLIFTDGLGRPLRPDLPGRMGAASAPLHLAAASCFSHPTVLARRASIPEGGYRPLAAEDYDLWLRFIADGRTIVRDPFAGLLYRRHAHQTSSSTEWLGRRENELAQGGLLDSYRSALDRLGLPADAPPSTLRFAMSMVPPQDAMDLAWLGELHERIGERARSLPAGERSALNARLRTLKNRVDSRDIQPAATR